MISRTSYVNNSIKFSFNDCCKRSIDNDLDGILILMTILEQWDFLIILK